MRLLRSIGYGLAVVALGLGVTLVYFAQSTRAEITAMEDRVAAAAVPFGAVDDAALADLPPPVARFFAFTFPDGIPAAPRYAEIEMAGEFRRPLTESFSPTTARQVASLRSPDMVFSADTPILGVLWAIAWDEYIGGAMEMSARVMSAVTVMHEEGNPTLDVISLRRWLLESSFYPMAMLPGGPVTWEPVDDLHAVAIVTGHGNEARLLASFDATGALVAFDATEPGDLTTPYHGSGEHVARSDYQLVDGVRVPMGFEVARVGADGVIRPFWRGRVTSLDFRQ